MNVDQVLYVTATPGVELDYLCWKLNTQVDVACLGVAAKIYNKTLRQDYSGTIFKDYDPDRYEHFYEYAGSILGVHDLVDFSNIPETIPYTGSPKIRHVVITSSLTEHLKETRQVSEAGVDEWIKTNLEITKHLFSLQPHIYLTKKLVYTDVTWVTHFLCKSLGVPFYGPNLELDEDVKDSIAFIPKPEEPPEIRKLKDREEVYNLIEVLKETHEKTLTMCENLGHWDNKRMVRELRRELLTL